MSWVQKFRERPRAVVIFPCARAEMSSLSCDLEDARHWVSSESGEFLIAIVLQGRVQVGDWVRLRINDGGRAVWSGNVAVKSLLARATSQVLMPVSANFNRGWYNIDVDCNGRLAGRAHLEVI